MKKSLLSLRLNGYKSNLHTPTYLTKLGRHYFLVDCWNHRVLYTDDVHTRIDSWFVLDDQLSGPHSIATDGSRLVVEDTGKHRLIVYDVEEKAVNGQELARGGGYVKTQVVPDVGTRPHRVLWHEQSKTFLTVGSEDQSLTVLSGKDKLQIQEKFSLFEIEKQYIRSITLHQDKLFVVGVRQIGIYHYSNGQIVFEQALNLNEKYWGSNDLFFFNQAFDGHQDPFGGLFTASPGLIVQFSNINELVTGQAHDLSRYSVGTPYFISKIESRFYVPEITEHSRLCAWEIHGGRLTNTSLIFDSQPPSPQNLKRKTKFPV